MHSTEIDRRRFLAWLLATGAAPVWAAEVDQGESPLYLAARLRDGRHEAVVLEADGSDKHVIPLPDRGHSFAIDAKRGRAVAFGRQPGFFAYAFALDGRGAVIALPLPKDRHFFGHGVFTPDGERLFATENDFNAGRGVLGVYEVSAAGTYRRVDEIDTGGIGPHEVILMPDGVTLCVANGGILTHPDYGKLELNRETMRSSLAYIDSRNGQLTEQIFLPQAWQHLSMRHLALDAAGCVWAGCQYIGPASHQPPLVARHARGQALQWYSGPSEVLRGMRNYVGSVAADLSGRTIATSSPVGNCVVFWDAFTGDFLGKINMHDGCGVAPAQPSGFLLTSGLGQVAKYETQPQPPGRNSQELSAEGAPVALRSDLSGLAWDNHLRRV